MAGSFAPPWRTTTFRGAAGGADVLRDERFVTTLFVSALEVAALEAAALGEAALESGLAGSDFVEPESVGFVFVESVPAESGSDLLLASFPGACCPAGAVVSGALPAGGAAGGCPAGGGWVVGDWLVTLAGPVAFSRRAASPRNRTLSPRANVKANRMM